MKKITKTINVNEVMKDITLEITITGIKVFRIRMVIGILLIKLAAWVLGYQVEFDINEDKTTEK